MAETSGFFDAEELIDGTFDREYIAQQWANYFKLFIGNGVFATPTNQLKVLATSGMNVKVLSGWAWINGYWYQNDGDLSLTIAANTTATTRIDGIFIRFDASERRISIVVGTGRTTVERTTTFYELKIAEVSVRVGVASILDSDIVDTRPNNSVCGFVTGLIDVITTEDLFQQYTAAFMEWFDEMKDQLSEDAAGHLQLEVDALNNRFSVSGSTLTISTL